MLLTDKSDAHKEYENNVIDASIWDIDEGSNEDQIICLRIYCDAYLR